MDKQQFVEIYNKVSSSDTGTFIFDGIFKREDSFGLPRIGEEFNLSLFGTHVAIVKQYQVSFSIDIVDMEAFIKLGGEYINSFG